MNDAKAIEVIQDATGIGWQISKSLRRFDAWRAKHRDLGLTTILVMQVAIIFLIAPMARAGLFDREVTQLLRITLATTAVLIVNRNHAFGIAVALLFVVSLLSTYYIHTGTASQVTYLLNILFTLTFDVAVSWIVAEAVFGPGQITVHRIMGAVILYLYIGMIFAAIYHLVDAIFYQGFSTLTNAKVSHLSEYLYFSFGALTTAGSGNILPIHPIARSLTLLESIIGQLFPATFIARLVTLHGSVFDSGNHKN